MSKIKLCVKGHIIGGKQYEAWAAHEDALLKPLHWRKPRHVELCRDLFHPNVTDEMRDRIFAVMALCPQHTFQVPTKRPETMREYLDFRTDNRADAIGDEARRITNTDGLFEFPLPNVHLGVSVENQATADARIPLLLQTTAAVRFISAEPLLGWVDLATDCDDSVPGMDGVPLMGGVFGRPCLDWVIAGGESGPGARPAHPDWFRSLMDQCVEAGVPFFFKQWGAWAPTWGSATHLLSLDGELVEGTHENPKAWKLKTHEAMRRVGKKAAGDLLDGARWHQMPEVRA